MTLEEALAAHLRAHATTGPLFARGTSPQSWRIHNEAIPAGSAYPALEFDRLSTDPLITLSGATTWRTVRFEINVYAASSAATATVAHAVRLALDGVTGTLGGIRIDYAHVEQFAQESTFDGEREGWRWTMDLVINLTE